jgi:ribosomal protein L20
VFGRLIRELCCEEKKGKRKKHLEEQSRGYYNRRASTYRDNLRSDRRGCVNEYKGVMGLKT